MISLSLAILVSGCAMDETLSKDDPLNTDPSTGEAISEVGFRIVNDPVADSWLFGGYTAHPAYSIFLDRVSDTGYLTGRGIRIPICGPTTPLADIGRCVGKGMQYKLFRAKVGRYALTQVEVYFPHLQFIGKVTNPLIVTLSGGGIEYIGDVVISFLGSKSLHVDMSRSDAAATSELQTYKNSHGKMMYLRGFGAS